MGKTSTGKDFLVSKLKEKYNWHKAVSYSSRPVRPNEVDGVDYFFRSYDEISNMIDNQETYEHTSYKTNMGEWLYAFGIDSFVDDNVNMAIVNPEGLYQILETELADRIVIVYVNVDDWTRVNRYNSRLGGIENMSIQQKAEAYERIIRDNNDFEKFDDWVMNVRDGIPILSILNYNQGLDENLFDIFLFVNEVNND